MELEKLIQEMQSQGTSNEQILQSLEQMVQEGKITAEDFERAKQLLQPQPQEQTNEEEEKANASKLFGMKLI